MPVVEHSSLPAFHRLRTEGVAVGQGEPGLPDLRIGLLNLMPDAALAATDRQFVRLVSGFGDRANLYVHPFTLAAWSRGDEAQTYVAENYLTFPDVKDRGLDALIITGANPAHFELSEEPFWRGLTEVIDWGEESVLSTLCSCLATHAVLEHKGLLKRSKLDSKRWGVYEHARLDADHPLLDGVDSSVEAPHSHWFDMTRTDLEGVGVKVLLESDEAGVHMATSEDGFRYVFFQGHPEYDDISLLKEYKREVGRYLAGEREYPVFPEHYFDDEAREVLGRFKEQVVGAGSPEFPEREVTRRWKPAWVTQGQAIYSNWLAEVLRRVGS